jgi:Predicted pyridoxal phosphate-dependent enzyme apparently involved in regulation of cell wall biogenesis
MIPVSIPFVSKNQIKYVNDCLERNWISSFGKYDKLLSESFSEFVGSKYASTCSNGTVAIHLALLAAGVKRGDEVILPNFNGPYALFACSYVGAVPVLIDINDKWDVEISSLKDSISLKTKAIIIPHLYGIPSRIKPLINFCKKK